jgi:hypothetical protein
MGYGRMENPDLIPVMNELYRDNWCLLKNFFTPCMKLVEEKRVGGKIIKKHDEPKTPYKRVLENPHVFDQNKQKLIKIYEALDPIELSNNIDALQKVVRRLARVSYEDWKNSQAANFH